MSRSYGQDWFTEDGPVYKIEVGLLKDVVTLTIDTSGEGLHKRGYREHSGQAPLKETLVCSYGFTFKVERRANSYRPMLWIRNNTNRSRYDS